MGRPPAWQTSVARRTEIAAIIMPSCVWRNYGVISNATLKSYLPPAQSNAEQVALCVHNDTLGEDAGVGLNLCSNV